VKLRDARPGDLVPLYELWRLAVQASPDMLTEDQRRELALAFRDRHMPGATMVVAVDRKGVVRGCVGYDSDGAAAVIDKIWVDPEHQGEGAGRGFVDWLKARHDRIEAVVNSGARDLRGFYGELGFKEKARRGGRDRDAYPDVTLVWERRSG